MELRVATLNVWGLPEPLSVDPQRRIAAVGAKLPDLEADVVAFQEVWFPSARARLLAAGLRAGLSYSWSPSERFGGSGLLVLSRLPIERATFTPFALSGLPERLTHAEFYSGKGYLVLQLATPHGPVSVLATHLHARYSGDVAHAYRSHRAGQVVQLALGIRQLGHPLIAAGDFNFTDDSREHSVLQGLSGMRDLALVAGRPEATALRSNPFRSHSKKPDRRLDYVFARDGRGARIGTKSVQRVFDELLDDGALTYSNHAGVLAHVEIEPAHADARVSYSLRAVEQARELLVQGQEAALQRRDEQRGLAGAGLGVAGLIALSDRRFAASRRRFLGAGLKLAAVATLTPTVGCSLLSEVFVPDEIRAYDRLLRGLDELHARLLRERDGTTGTSA